MQNNMHTNQSKGWGEIVQEGVLGFCNDERHIWRFCAKNVLETNESVRGFS